MQTFRDKIQRGIRLNGYGQNLLILYAGRFVSLIGDRIYLIALTFLLAHRHPGFLTVLWVISLVAPILTQMIAGSVTDHFGSKKTAILSDIVRALATGLMPLTLESPVLFLLVFIVSGAGAFFSSSLYPLVTNLTAVDTRQKVNSILNSVGSAAMFIGPLIGGLLLAKSPVFPFLIQSFTFVVSATALLIIPAPKLGNTQPRQPHENRLRSFWADIRLAWNFVMKHAVLKKIMWIAIFINLGGGTLDAYEVLYVTKAVHLGSTGYAGVVSGSGIAFFLAGVINARYAKRLAPSQRLAVGTLLLVGGLVPYAFSFNFAMIISSIFVFAFGMVTTMTAISTIRQNAIPVDIQGRVTSLQSTLQISAGALSVLVGGALIPVLPIRSIITGAVIAAAFSLPVAWTAWSDEPVSSDVKA